MAGVEKTIDVLKFCSLLENFLFGGLPFFQREGRGRHVTIGKKKEGAQKGNKSSFAGRD